MKKCILIILYSLFYIWIVFPFQNVNNLYLWSINQPQVMENNKSSSLYLIIWSSDLAKKVVNFKIKNSFFHYEKEKEMNYDLFMTTNEYSLNEIYKLIKNRPESTYYDLLKLLKEGNQKYFENNDEQIIKSLKVILNKEIYKKELKENYKIIIPKLLKRVNNIKENNDYYKIYKEYLKKQLEEIL